MQHIVHLSKFGVNFVHTRENALDIRHIKQSLEMVYHVLHLST